MSVHLALSTAASAEKHSANIPPPLPVKVVDLGRMAWGLWFAVGKGVQSHSSTGKRQVLERGVGSRSSRRNQ